MTMIVSLSVAMAMRGDSIRIAMGRRNERIINEGPSRRLVLDGGMQTNNRLKENR
jgi:hypothetical protein